MAIFVCRINLNLVMESGTRKGRALVMSVSVPWPFVYGGDNMNKAWSKATPEQREKHRQSCIEVGKWKRCYNWVTRICELAQKMNIDGCDYLLVWDLILKNNKHPLEVSKGQRMIKLLQKKMKPEKVYQRVFES